ncbi:mycothiol-dependent nitroreductase Rv2466c family protein [Micromonospora andamanensis]|uniref:mycothiol-dependent nitroreductase Rv2466c family protein n=1 Tax=Micromonospora andamanensis TaxID=1287068 RepID=UPI003570D781
MPPELRSLSEAGLPASVASAATSTELDQLIIDSHEAFDEIGIDVGTPVIRISGNALFGADLRRPVLAQTPVGLEYRLRAVAERSSGTGVCRNRRWWGARRPGGRGHAGGRGQRRTGDVGIPAGPSCWEVGCGGATRSPVPHELQQPIGLFGLTP